MTEAIKKLQEERTGLFADLYRGKPLGASPSGAG